MQEQDITATPTWGKSLEDHIKYLIWIGRERRELYTRFAAAADEWLKGNPGKVLRAEYVVNVLRVTEQGIEGDQYAVNSNLKALFARLYALEHPGTRIQRRGSFLDDLEPGVWYAIIEAFGLEHHITRRAA